MMIKIIISITKSFLNGSIFMNAIKEEQKEFRKDHCLQRYGDSDDWRDELF